MKRIYKILLILLLLIPINAYADTNSITSSDENIVFICVIVGIIISVLAYITILLVNKKDSK